MSHLFEQAIGLYLTLDLGADILYVRSRNPRVLFEAIREHRMTGDDRRPAVPRPLLGGRSSARWRARAGPRSFRRARAIARRLPMGPGA